MAKIIYVDIDGILCTQDGTNYENAEPIEDNIKYINSLYNHYKIIIWTARGTGSGKDYSELTKNQLKQWKVKYHKLIFGKPVYDLIIDDKAIGLARLRKLVG